MYLSNRTQSVKCNSTISEELIIKTGVPQGSILGPLLFLLYVNDLHLHLTCSDLDMYADDSTLSVTDRSVAVIQNKVQSDLLKIEKWCVANNMILNPTKTTAILIGTPYKTKRSTPLTLTVNGFKIKSVTNQKVLGIDIDQHLKWDIHIDSVCKKLSTKFTLLRKVSKFLNLEMKQMFYHAYLVPVFDYGSIIWCNAPKSYISKVYSFQKSVARWILIKPLSTSSNIMFKELKWLSIENRHKMHIAIMTFKALHGLTPTYIKQIITVSENKTYSLRSNSKCLLSHFRHNSEYMKQSFKFLSLLCWNSLPETVRNTSSLSSFKYKCKQFYQAGNK